MAGQKMMPPNVRIDWIPFAGLTAPSAPSIAQLNAGTNLSAAIVTGYKLNALPSDVDTSKSIVDESDVETPTMGNYEAMLELYRDAIGDAPTVYTTAYNLFKTSRARGWLVKRYGSKNNVAYAVGDIVSVFLVVSDDLQEKGGEKGKPTLFAVDFAPQGQMFLNKACVA